MTTTTTDRRDYQRALEMERDQLAAASQRAECPRQLQQRRSAGSRIHTAKRPRVVMCAENHLAIGNTRPGHACDDVADGAQAVVHQHAQSYAYLAAAVMRQLQNVRLKPFRILHEQIGPIFLIAWEQETMRSAPGSGLNPHNQARVIQQRIAKILRIGAHDLPNCVIDGALSDSQSSEIFTREVTLRQKIVELNEHPWFVASQFHPEFKSRPTRPAPLFREFVQAALERARERRGDRVEVARN